MIPSSLYALLFGIGLSCVGCGSRAAVPITESGQIPCNGTTEAIYTNHGSRTKEMHIKVQNACDDTLLVEAAELAVVDNAGKVWNGQQVTIPLGRTHRGTIEVPAKGKVNLTCSTADLGACKWEYTYAINP